MNEMMRDVQADDARLRRLSAVRRFFGRMAMAGVLGLVVAFVPMFVFTDLAESLYPLVAGVVVMALIFGGIAGGSLVSGSIKRLAASYTPTVLAQDGSLFLVVRDMDLFEAGESQSTEELTQSIRGGMDRLGRVLDLLDFRGLSHR